MAKNNSFSMKTIIMKEWIFQLSKDDFESLGPVRCMPGLQAAVEENIIWLRGITASVAPDLSLLKLPLKKTFLLDEEDNLFLTGALTPVEKLHKLNWQPVASFINIEAPVSALPGKTKNKVRIQLKNSYEERPGIALLTSLSAWKGYAETAPDTRLKALRYAVSENEEVLITGTPLPPLPGREYWGYENLLLPSGYDFEIPVMATLISQQLQDKDDIIVFDPTAGWQRIPGSYFIPATRSSIRLTQVKPSND
jgi:MoxR-vWA-beta-propeller ternary system domain bpX2